jgi:Tfp pilus assembly protein PilX
MPTPVPRANQAQTGAITIMVALMLLVLLTLSAIGMSRNSFREVVNSAFSRQDLQPGRFGVGLVHLLDH